MKLLKMELDAYAAANANPLKADERYIVVGPHCWGRAVTFVEALKNAKSNRVRSYEGKAGWRFMVFVADGSVRIDDMGGFVYMPREDDTLPYREIWRTPTK